MFKSLITNIKLKKHNFLLNNINQNLDDNIVSGNASGNILNIDVTNTNNTSDNIKSTFNLLNKVETELYCDINKMQSKLLKKICIIKQLLCANTLLLTETQINNIINNFQRLDIKNTIEYCTDSKYKSYKNFETLNKKLGHMLHSIYESSECQMLLTNIPTHGKCIGASNTENITPEHIYNTIIRISGDNSVSVVFQIDEVTYLVKFKTDSLAKETCTLINKNLIENNVINAMYIDKIATITQLPPNTNAETYDINCVANANVEKQGGYLTMLKSRFNIINTVINWFN